MAEKQNLLSFKSKDFVEGGLLADGKYLIKKNTFVEWDYDGRVPGAKTTTLKVVMVPITVDSKGVIKESGDEKLHYASAGDPDKIQPSKNGLGLVALGETKGPSKQSNFFQWYISFVNAGFDEDAFDGTDISVFDDMAVEVYNEAAPKRDIQPKSNLVQAGDQGPQRERTIAKVRVIGKMPGEKKWNLAAVPASGAVAKQERSDVAESGKTNGKAKSSDEASPEAILAEHFQKVIGKEKAITRTEARVGTYKLLGGAGLDADAKKAVMALFQDDSALEKIINNIGDGYAIVGDNIEAM